MPASDWKKTIKPASTSGAKDWRKTARPMTEDEAMEYATRQADIKYEADAPGIGETAVRSGLHGATLGLSDYPLAGISSLRSGLSMSDELQEIEKRRKRGEQENPATALTSGIAGAVGTAPFLPGAAVFKGAKALGPLTKLSRGKEIAKQGLKQAGVSGAYGATEGLATSRGDLGKGAESAGIGAAIPGVLQGAGALGKGALNLGKKLIPGSSQSPALLNKAVAQASRITGADKHTADVYEDLLNKPQRMKEALRPNLDKVDEIPVVNQRIAESFENIDDQIWKKYEEDQAVAFAKNVENLPDFERHLTTANEYVDNLIDQVNKYPKHFNNRTQNVISTTKDILSLNDPYVGNLAKTFEDIQNRAMIAVKNNDQAALQGLEIERTKALRGLGSSLTRAKRDIDDAIDWNKDNNYSIDARRLKELRKKINQLTHGPTGGAAEMKRADALYSDYKSKARPFIEQFTGRGPEGLSSKKIGDFITEAGSPYKQAEIKAYERSAKKFFDEAGIDASGIDEAVGSLQHWKDQAAINRLGGQTGQQTGRGSYPLIAGAVFGFIHPALGLAIAGLSSPSMTPTKYLGLLQGTRDLISKIGEDEVAKQFGARWPAIKNALGRQVITPEDVRESAMEFAPIAKEIKGAQNNQKANSAISPEVRERLKRGGASIPGTQESGVTDPRALAQQNIQKEMSDMYPKDSTFSGRSQSVLDNLIGADKIGLDPGEEPSPTQPTKGDEDYLSRIPFLPAGTVTRLSPKVREYLRRKREGRLTENENLENISKYQRPSDKTLGDNQVDRIQDFKKGKYDFEGSVYAKHKRDAEGEYDLWDESESEFGKRLKEGYGDPFSWPQDKYRITKEYIRKNGKNIKSIRTRSDLIAHDDYINALDQYVSKDVPINIHLSPGNNRTGKIIESGSPSLKRRIKAALKLKDRGFKVIINQDKFDSDEPIAKLLNDHAAQSLMDELQKQETNLLRSGLEFRENILPSDKKAIESLKRVLGDIK